MKITHIYNQGSGKLNEDDYIVADPLFAVFDGATSLVKYVSDSGQTGGKLASTIAKDVFEKNNGSIANLAKAANNKLEQEMKQAGIDTNQLDAIWSTSCAAVSVGDKEIECFSIGDSLIVAERVDGTIGLVFPYNDHDKETLEMWYAREDKKGNMIELMLDQITKVRSQANKTYGCMNGQPAAENFFNTTTLPRADINILLLITDGIFLPKEDPDTPEDWGSFVKMYHEGGLEGITNHVRMLEAADEDLEKYPRFKQHDDIAAIAIEL